MSSSFPATKAHKQAHDTHTHRTPPYAHSVDAELLLRGTRAWREALLVDQPAINDATHPTKPQMATRRQASLSSAGSPTKKLGSNTTNGASVSTIPTAPSTKSVNGSYTTSKAAVAAAAAPVPLLPADVEDEMKGYVSAGTHYILEGPPTGKLVVCVPGLGGPHWYFDELVPFLIQAGFRVLRYDLVGRGHSARPAQRTRRPSCFCNGVAREKDPYGMCFLVFDGRK